MMEIVCKSIFFINKLHNIFVVLPNSFIIHIVILIEIAFEAINKLFQAIGIAIVDTKEIKNKVYINFKI